MFKNKRILGVIPARGGSKRLPRKNILNLAGKPLIAWTIESAKKSKYFDEVLVSTDDLEIAEISRQYGASIPFMRPNELATDESKSIDVVINALEVYKKERNVEFDYVALLQPTSPLRNEKHIDEAVELLFKKDACGIISVCEAEHSPLWTNTLPNNGDMSNFLSSDLIDKRGQDLPKYYRLNGAIYICKTEKLFKEKTFFIKNNIYAYIMDKYSSVDIDSDFDFKLAEMFIND